MVCGKCRYSDPDFDLITKTNAKQNYLLTDNDLRDVNLKILKFYVFNVSFRRLSWVSLKKKVKIQNLHEEYK